jgi:uroporphyrinogen decarboxylase
MVSDTACQVGAQLAIHEKFKTPFVLSAMDLSVEAEEFGATILVSDREVPTVTGRLVTDPESVNALRVPQVGRKRSTVYLNTIRALRRQIPGSLVLGGMIGPFSLAGRLFGVSEALAETAGEPDMMHALLRKVTDYLREYALAFKAAGAHGVVMAEPTAGLISPASVMQFSTPYIREIVEAVDDAQFQVILHNCAARLGHLQAKLATGARILHFGKPMDIVAALERVPEDVILCGNLDPSEVFVNSSPEEVDGRTRELLAATAGHKNFVISSGCDIPAAAPIDNLEAFFGACPLASGHLNLPFHHARPRRH